MVAYARLFAGLVLEIYKGVLQAPYVFATRRWFTQPLTASL